MTTGFKITNEGTRVLEEYVSDHERTWCECKELVQHEYYKEAHEKLDEYWEYCPGKPDWKLVLAVELGFLKVKPSEKGFKNVVDLWGNAMVQDSGMDHDEFFELAEEIVGSYITFAKIRVEDDDFSKATVKQTEKLLDFMYLFLAFDFEDTEFLQPVVNGIRHLTDKGELTKAKQYYTRVLKLGAGTYESFIKEEEDFMMGVEEV